MYGSIDLVVDKLNVKLGARIKQKSKRKIVLSLVQVKLFTDAVVEEATTQKKSCSLKTIDPEPMDLDEAILQMDLLAK